MASIPLPDTIDPQSPSEMPPTAPPLGTDLERLTGLGAERPVNAFVVNGELRRAIHTRLTDLRYSSSIGGTHVDQLAASGAGKSLPGPRATLFFAPAQIKKRTAEWGADVFGQRMAAAWHAFTTHATGAQPPWLTVQHHDGGTAVASAYADVLAGKGDARVGHILSLSRSPAAR